MTSSNQPSQEALSVAQIIVSKRKRPSKQKVRLKKLLFTFWLKDNVDVNPKANFNKSSYHGTSYHGTSSSIGQFRNTKDDGEDFPPIHSLIRWLKNLRNLLPCLLNTLQSKMYTHQNLILNFGHRPHLIMYRQQNFPITILPLQKSSSGLTSAQIYYLNSIIFTLLDGLHIMHQRNVAY